MTQKTETFALSVKDAITEGYREIDRLRDEINHWWRGRGPKLGPENTTLAMRVQALCQDLERIETPNVASLPENVAAFELRADLCVGSHSRRVRCGNAEAKLRLAAAALRKNGSGELAEKIGNDIGRMPLIFPAAYSRA